MVIDTSKISTGSWKTNVAAVVTFVAGFILINPALFVKWPIVYELAKYVGVGGVGVGFFSAKDSNVTGGTVLQSNAIPDARLHAEAVVAKVETPAEASPVPVPPKP